MSLFSSTYRESLTSYDTITSRAGFNEIFPATLRLTFFGTMLGLLMVLTIIAIILVRLQPVPAFPGTKTGGHPTASNFVQALYTLHPTSPFPPQLMDTHPGNIPHEIF
jgi:hypothetical protein